MNMKYIKKRYEFLNEAFDSKAISRTLSFLDKKFKDKSTKSKFLNVIKRLKDNYDYPIDKINDAFIKYTNKNEALKIKFDGELQNSWDIYCLKFWFSLESGYIGYTATSNINYTYSKKSEGLENIPFSNDELDYIKSRKGIETGKLIPVTDYSLFKNGDKVVGCFSGYLENSYISPATIVIHDGILYAIQDVNEGDAPSDRTNWREFGRYSWNIGKLNGRSEDHKKLHLYIFDNEPLRVDLGDKVETKQEQNPLEWNLPVKSNGRISQWNDDYSSIDDESDLEKADFSIILFFDDMINPDKAEFYETPSDISKDRKESKKGALKLMSDEEIKKLNIERYLNQLILKLGISVDKSDVKNLQKVIGTSLVGQYSLISILSSEYVYINSFIDYLLDLIKSSDKEYYFKRLIDQYKAIYNRSSNNRKKYDTTFNWIDSNYNWEGRDDEKVLFIEVLSKVIGLGNKIFDIVSNKEINSIQDMRITKYKLDSLRNLLDEDDFKFSDRIKSIFSRFGNKADVSYYLDRLNINELKEAKENLIHIEKAIDSMLK